MSDQELDHLSRDTFSGGEYTPTKSKAKPKAKAKRPKASLYPSGIARLTRKGKGTYAVGCGPLPDGIDWSELDIAVLKEQCNMRDLNQNGKRDEIVRRLTDYKERDFTSLAARSDVVGVYKSATGERRRTA